jgi:DNA polymerase elongation subunit (family B)
MHDTDDFLAHHGIKGQKWGIRRFQNEDGSLTDAGKKHYQKLDTKWAKKNTDKIIKKTQKKIRRDLEDYNRELARSPDYLNINGQVSKSAINAYNRRMAQLMNTAVGDIEAPSGRVVKFIAKRGDVGVQMALADREYDIDQLRNGVWTGGRVAYRSNQLDKIDI